MSTTTSDAIRDREASDRQHRLAAAVARLRTKAGGLDLARVLLITGGILMPLGVVLIVLGWLGASHTVNLFEQIPYAISGGLLGLALVFAGGFCYFAYWMTQLVYDARRERADTRAVLERIERLLASSATVAGEETTNGASTHSLDVASRPVGFLATATGTMFHRSDCPAVAQRDGLRAVTGAEPGLTPCKICQPLS